MASSDPPRDELQVLVAQLLACRAQIDATLAYVAGIELGPSADVCSHPVDQRKILPGTMGGPVTFECGVCNAVVTEPSAAPAAGA